VHFTGSDVEEILTECGVPQGQNVFWAGITSDIRSMYCQMIRELQTKGTHYAELLRMNLRHLFLLMHRHLIDVPNEETPVQGEIVQAVGWFERHWREPISIDDYAERNHMTPYWFRQKFKQFTGTTPMQYVISLRINNAMNLMENTDYNIEQIAEAVGYDNPSYFRRLFHKHTGLSPSEYRQHHKK
jgi:transcriptional regulator GlxA family with amidase domain